MKISEQDRRLLSYTFWAYVSIWLILSSLVGIRDTMQHHGRGWVSYEDDGKEVSEDQFKRHYYTMHGFMLVIGIGIAIPVWKSRPRYNPHNLVLHEN